MIRFCASRPFGLHTETWPSAPKSSLIEKELFLRGGVPAETEVAVRKAIEAENDIAVDVSELQGGGQVGAKQYQIVLVSQNL